MRTRIEVQRRRGGLAERHDLAVDDDRAVGRAADADLVEMRSQLADYLSRDSRRRAFRWDSGRPHAQRASARARACLLLCGRGWRSAAPRGSARRGRRFRSGRPRSRSPSLKARRPASNSSAAVFRARRRGRGRPDNSHVIVAKRPTTPAGSQSHARSLASLLGAHAVKSHEGAPRR